MEDELGMTEAEYTLQLIRDDNYSTTRPDSLLIKELIQVIKLLDEKIQKLGV